MIAKVFNGGYLTRLDNIIQWQERDVHQRESVSQHSYKVSVFCKVLLDEIFSVPADLDMEIASFKYECLSHAMFHDWDEALIARDLSHNMKYNKYNGDAIRKVVDDLAQHLAELEFYTQQDSAAGKRIYDAICNYHESVHIFVKLCDWLALAYFVNREIKLGNKDFQREFEYCKADVVENVRKVREMMLKEFGEGRVNFYTLDSLVEQIYQKQ